MANETGVRGKRDRSFPVGPGVRGLRLLVFAAFGSSVFSFAAWACPQCVRAEGGGYGKYALLASMILLPFAITGAAIHFIRRVDFDHDDK